MRLLNACQKLERQIVEDKLSQGINGLEWLVLHTEVDKKRASEFMDWTDSLRVYGYDDDELTTIMRDVVTMSVREFFLNHKISWESAIRHTLTYLSRLRKCDYDAYSDLIRSFYGG